LQNDRSRSAEIHGDCKW